MAQMRARYAREAERIGAQQKKSSQQIQQDLDEQAGRLEEYLVELKQLGVEPRNGPGGRIDTVDFPSERNGRTVYLCWQLGEQEISHWHDLEAGFAGRQQLFAGANAEEER